MKPIDITDGNFQQEVANAAMPVLIDFWAVWCGPCRLIAPIVDKLAAAYDGKIKFGKLDVDNNQETALAYGIRGIPTILLFDKGQVADRIVGVVSESQIRERLDRVLEAV